MIRNRQISAAVGRLLALLLVLTMAFSLALEGSALTMEQPSEETEQQIGSLEETASETEKPPAGTGETEQQTEPEAAPETGAETPAYPEGEEAPDPSEPEAGPSEPDSEHPDWETPEQPLSEERGEAVELPEEAADAYALNEIGSEQLTLQYDDRYDFAEAYEGYTIYSIQNGQSSSYQVSGGSRTSKRDENVLRLDGDSQTKVVASGVGSATVLLVAEGQETESTDDGGSGDAQPEQVDTLRVRVTVKAAKLTLMFLAGQSNMEGYCSNYTSSQRRNSIACPEGQVYSTYLPKSDTNGTKIGGIDSSTYTEDPENVVAGSLTGTVSRSGEALNYPLNTLTEQGKGKTGMDSGLAYEWNRLTGDKVWTVNAGNGDSSVSEWKQGSSIYERAYDVFGAALKTYRAEISAGHYTEGSRLLFWLQGEKDRSWSASNYLSAFQSMHQGFADGLGVQYFGLITVRSSQGSYTNGEDIYMNGPRIAQYYIGNSSSSQYSDVYVVSNVNEQWVSDGGVRTYFRTAYPGGSFTYPLRANTTLSGLPTTVQEIHENIHYSQPAHNENGLTAARNMYYIVYVNGPESSVSVSWRDEQGKTAAQPFSLKNGESAVVVPVVEPLYRSKQISYQVSSSALSYSAASGTLTGNAVGNASLKALNTAGKQVSALSVTVAKLSAPALKTIANRTGGVYITWSAVSGASGYRVYRRIPGKSWEQLGTTTATSYTDSSAVSGTSYIYTVQAYKGKDFSGYDAAGLSITYLAPTTVKLANSTSGVKVTWKKIPKAEGYYVYRRLTGESWKRLASISDVDTLTYTDTGAASGTDYEYTVTGYLNGCKSGYTGVAWVYLTTPSVNGAQNVENGVKVSWSKVTGADSYAVYRKSGSSKWSRIATVDGGAKVNYTDTTAAHGTAYTYTVRAVRGKYASYYQSAGKSVTYVKTPVMKTLQNTEQGTKLTWGALSGVDSYVVYRKNAGDSGWTKLDTVTGTSYTDQSGLNSGATYLYTLRARKGEAVSGYHTAGYSILFLAAPQIAKAANTADGIRLTWEQVKGASGYVVYRKSAGDSGWTKLDAVTDTGYTDKEGLKSGTTYTYTLRAKKGETVSGYHAAGHSILCLATPQITKATNTASGVRLTWEQVKGASGYVVYRKTADDSGWIKLATVTGTGYTDTDVKSGATYRYTLRAQKNQTLSGYQSSGCTDIWLSVPALSKAVSGSRGIQVTWGKVAGADGYQVYRKTSGSGWTLLGTVSGTSYTDKSASSHTAYTYTVRACRDRYLSDYDRGGISAAAK